MGLEERSLAQTGPRPERPHARADWKQMLGIGIVASILGIIAGLLIDWFPVAASEELHRAIPGSELVVFPGPPHLVTIEAPDRFNEVTLDWLRKTVERS